MCGAPVEVVEVVIVACEGRFVALERRDTLLPQGEKFRLDEGQGCLELCVKANHPLT